MKKAIIYLLLFVFSMNAAFADCDWKTGITPGPNNTFIYSEACHLTVGKLVQDNKVKDEQIADLNKAIELKDLALTNADARVALWEKSSLDELDRLNKISADSKTNEWLFFGLGAITIIGAGFMTARLIGK